MAQPSVETQSKEKRRQNFHEVSSGYSKKVTAEEARRCPQCADPVCMRGCPIGIAIPSFIRLLREGNITAAYDKIKEQNPFPSICGRICSAPCEAACVLNDEQSPIGIRALERYAADNGRTKLIKRESISAKKIAIIGSGPSGLTAAVEMAKKGFAVTVFELLDKPGGTLRYGIPEFRIPRKILDHEINEIKALGVVFKTNFFIGQTATLDELFKKGFSAILIATGAGIPQFMNLPGANLGGVYYGEEFLMRVNWARDRIMSGQIPNFGIGRRIAVIGSGNTALDCARVGVRFGREVTLVFRRTEDEMRVRKQEREFGKEEGVQFEPLVKPLEIIADEKNFVGGLRCVRMDYAENEETKKWELVEVPDSEFIMDVDTVIIAIGHRPNSLLSRASLPFKINSDQTIWVDQETGMTSVPAVFATGNVVTNAGPVVQAIAQGKKAAENLEKFLKA